MFKFTPPLTLQSHRKLRTQKLNECEKKKREKKIYCVHELRIIYYEYFTVRPTNSRIRHIRTFAHTTCELTKDYTVGQN
jgi:hypothetical protein